MRINFIKKVIKKVIQKMIKYIFQSVGIMAPNHPYWFVSSLGAIFAGGLRSESGHL